MKMLEVDYQGTKYRMVTRKAKRGDLIKVFNHPVERANGIKRVTCSYPNGGVDFHVDYEGECGIREEGQGTFYLVLEPIN